MKDTELDEMKDNCSTLSCCKFKTHDFYPFPWLSQAIKNKNKKYLQGSRKHPTGKYDPYICI